MAVDLTVVSFGGANKSAQIKAFYEPYQKATGNRIVAGEYNGEMAKVKAMVDTNSVSWDLVEVESPELSRGCDEGLFEELDPAQFGKTEDFVPGAIQPCGVGFFVWSTVLAYNADKLKSAPTSWADFWDIKKFTEHRSGARQPPAGVGHVDGAGVAERAAGGTAGSDVVTGYAYSLHSAYPVRFVRFTCRDRPGAHAGLCPRRPADRGRLVLAGGTRAVASRSGGGRPECRGTCRDGQRRGVKEKALAPLRRAAMDLSLQL